MIVPTEKQARILNEMGSGISQSFENGNITISIVDMKTQKVWHKATGISEQEAFNTAVETISQSQKPKSNSEIAESAITLESENKELREKIAQLQTASKLVSPKSGTPSLKIETSQ